MNILGDLSKDGFTKVVIISDWLMPGMEGDEFLIECHRCFPHVIKIMLSGHADKEAIKRSRDQVNLYDFFEKPWDLEELNVSIHNGLKTFFKPRQQ